MIVSSRYLFLGAACLLAATIAACDSNQAAPSTTPPPAPSPAPAPAPSPTPSPSPAPTPAPSVFTISGTVAETAPTTDRFLDSVRLSTGDKAVNTDSAGRFSLSDLPAGSYSLRAEKSGYQEQTVSFTLPNDAGRVLQFNLEPNYEERNVERSGTVGPDSPICHGGNDPCARYDFPSHHSEPVMATLFWSSSDAEFHLEMRCNGEQVAIETERGEGDVRRDGEDYLYIELEAESQKGKTCEIRGLHKSGPEQKWILAVTHTN